VVGALTALAAAAWGLKLSPIRVFRIGAAVQGGLCALLGVAAISTGSVVGGVLLLASGLLFFLGRVPGVPGLVVTLAACSCIAGVIQTRVACDWSEGFLLLAVTGALVGMLAMTGREMDEHEISATT
jgi:hypothetical protein